MDTTPSWQYFDSSDSANHGPGYCTRDNISGHSTHLVSRTTRSIQEEPANAPSCVNPSDSTQDHHMLYYPHEVWDLNPTPPPLRFQDAPYGPPTTAAAAANGPSNTTYQYDNSSSSSGGDSHHHHHHPSSSASWPSFTPINRNGSTVAPFSSSSSKVSRTPL